jgi:phenylacetate-coenzyme A ligase PaaK-like adenylate-forming protein
LRFVFFAAIVSAPSELVFTSLTKEALPVIRYRTREFDTDDPFQAPCNAPKTKPSSSSKT